MKTLGFLFQLHSFSVNHRYLALEPLQYAMAGPEYNARSSNVQRQINSLANSHATVEVTSSNTSDYAALNSLLEDLAPFTPYQALNFSSQHPDPDPAFTAPSRQQNNPPDLQQGFSQGHQDGPQSFHAHGYRYHHYLSQAK